MRCFCYSTVDNTASGNNAQSILEAMFAIIIILFILYGLIKASRWGMIDLIDRRIRHDASLLSNNDGLNQLNPQTYRVRNPDLEYRTTAGPYTW